MERDRRGEGLFIREQKGGKEGKGTENGEKGNYSKVKVSTLNNG